MNRLSLLVIPIFVCLQPICAQELWVRPDKYFYNQNEVAKVEMLSGKNFIGEPVQLLKEQITSLDLVYRNGKIDMRRNFIESDKSHFTASLSADGIYAIMMKLKSRELLLKRSEFLEYIGQFGVEEIVGDTTTVGDTTIVDVEQTMKCYLRVGKQFDRRPEALSESKIQIIPDKNPLVLKRGEKITFKILKDGKPAFGVRVKIWNRWDNRTSIQYIYTLQDGTVSTTVSSPGDWMVSVVRLIKSEKQNSYIAETFDMIFGYR
jgi:hypothetical protein